MRGGRAAGAKGNTPALPAGAARAAALAGLAITLGACTIPLPFGSPGKADPGPPRAPASPSAVSTPAAVADAAVAAWRHDDAAALGRLSTQTAADDLLKRPFPSPPPTLINCQARTVPGTETCLFTNGALNFTLFVQQDQQAGGWAVARSRFLP